MSADSCDGYRILTQTEIDEEGNQTWTEHFDGLDWFCFKDALFGEISRTPIHKSTKPSIDIQWCKECHYRLKSAYDGYAWICPKCGAEYDKDTYWCPSKEDSYY